MKSNPPLIIEIAVFSQAVFLILETFLDQKN